MNKTPNYQLNQWAKSDRVLMDDFNADNAKLDAALKANASAISAETSARISAVQAARDACPLVTIKSVVIPEATDQFDLDLTGLDWDTYFEIIISMRLMSSRSATNLEVLLDGVTGMGKYKLPSGYDAEALYKLRIDAPAVHSVTCRIPRALQGFQTLWWGGPSAMSPHYSRINSDAARSSFSAMNFVGGLAAGCSFTFLGLKD